MLAYGERSRVHETCVDGPARPRRDGRHARRRRRGADAAKAMARPAEVRRFTRRPAGSSPRAACCPGTATSSPAKTTTSHPCPLPGLRPRQRALIHSGGGEMTITGGPETCAYPPHPERPAATARRRLVADSAARLPGWLGHAPAERVPFGRPGDLDGRGDPARPARLGHHPRGMVIVAAATLAAGTGRSARPVPRGSTSGSAAPNSPPSPALPGVVHRGCDLGPAGRPV